MSDKQDKQSSKPRTLKAALALAKDQSADRTDVVVDLQVAELGRLELLADELRPLMAELDPADERWELALSTGSRPRLWIDMTSFVAMGTDKRTYRLLKDTRAGRIVMAETSTLDKMGDIVSQYVAEKVLEREQMLEGERVYVTSPADEVSVSAKTSKDGAKSEKQKSKGGFWRSFGWFFFGILCTVAALAGAAFVLAPDAFYGLG